MAQISKQEAEDLIRSTGGKIFKADFIKADGSFRSGTFRLSVTRHIKGGGLKFKPADYGLITVYDMMKKAYRSIPLDRLLSIKVSGEVFEIG